MKKDRKTAWLIALALMCVLVFTVSGTCEAKTAGAAALTGAEKKQFRKYLKGGIEDNCYMSKKQGPLYGAEFFVYDINGDGRKDVIVSGALGLRDKSLSEIYMHADGKYKVIPIDGKLKGVSAKGLNFVDEDYSGAGEIRYYSRTAYRFDRHGRMIAADSYSVETMYYDTASGKEYPNGKVVSKKYLDIKGQKISQSVYKKSLAKTNKKKNVKMHAITGTNVDKYLK